MTVGQLDPREQPGIIQGHGGVAGDGLDQIAVCGRERVSAS